MITKNILNRYLAVAMTCLFTSAAVWAEAPTPVATWTDFSSFTPGTELSLPSNEGNHNLSIPANAQLADDGALVIGSSGGLSINYTGSKLVTFELEVSNVPTNDKVPAGIVLGGNAVILQSNDGSLYQRATSSMGTDYGSYDWDPSTKQTITIAYSGPNGGIQGTQTYINGESVIERAGGLRWAATDISALRIGFQYSNVRLATGMKVHAIRVYSTRLSDEEVAAAYEANLPEPEYPEVVSINFNQTSGKTGMSDYQLVDTENYTTLNGNIPGSAWNVVTKNNATTTATVNKAYQGGETVTISEDMTVEIKTEGALNYGCNETHGLHLGEDSIADEYKYLGIYATVYDKTATHTSNYIQLSNIPYSYYDVYIYFQSGIIDNGENQLSGLPCVKISEGNAALDSTKYYPAKENGEPDVDNPQESSTATHWGERQTTVPELGKNVMVIRGCAGTFKAEYQTQNFGPAAVQIVNNTDKIQIDCEDNYRISTANAREPVPDILCFNSGSTLIVDEEPTKRYVVTSEGLVTVRGTEGHPLTQSDVAKIALANDSDAIIKYVFTSVPEGLAAPAAGIIYRFESETELNGLPFNTVAVPGIIEIAAPIANQTIAEYRYRQNVVFDDGFSLTAEKIQFGNQNSDTIQVFTQKGGSITATAAFDSDPSTMNDTANTPLIFAHWPSTVTYNLLGGTLTAENSTVGFGRDGSVAMTVGGGETPATFKALGISHNSRGQSNRTGLLKISQNGTVQLGARGIYMGTSYKKMVLDGGTLEAYDTCTVNDPDNAIEIAKTSTIKVAADKTMTISTSSFTGSGYLIKTGEGVLDLGTNRPTIDVQAGQVKLTLLTEELIAGELVLTVPENAADADKSKISIVDSEGDDVVISEVTKEGTTLTVTLDSGMPKITEAKTISELQLDSELEGILIIQGADSSEGRFTVTFDEELPEGVGVLVVGYADLAGDYIPNTKLSFKSGANVTMSTFTGTIDTGITITAESATGTVTNNGTLNLTGESEFTLINTGVVNFKSGANASVSASADGQSIRGTINVEKGATFINQTNDAIPYNGDPVTFYIYGTLAMGTTRWTVGSTDVINLYGGATITGTDEGEGNFDLYHPGEVIRVIAVEGEENSVEIGRIRSRISSANANNDPPAINVGEGMTLIVNGGINAGGASEGSRVVKNGAGALTIKSGLSASELNIAAGTVTLDTGTGNFPMKANIIGIPTINGTGTIQLQDGAALDLGTKKHDIPVHFVAQGGTSTIKWTGDGADSICSNDTKDNPFITVNSGATLNIYGHDYSGWNGGLTDHGWIKNDGTLVFQNDGGSRFWRDHIVFGNGATMKIDTGDRDIMLYGGAGTAEASQFMLESGTATIEQGTENQNKSNCALRLGNDQGGGYGTKGVGIFVGEDAVLTVSVPLKSNKGDALSKWGEGTLKLTNVSNDFSGELEINGGAVELDECTLSVTKLSGSGTVSGTGHLTVTEEFAGVKAVEGMLILADGVKITSENKTEVVAITFGNSLKIKAMPGDVIFESYWRFAATLPTITLIDANGNDISGDYSLMVQEVPGKDHYWQIVIDDPNQQVPTISGVGNNLSEILAANPGAYKIKLTEKTGTELVIDTDENLPSILDILPGDEEGEYELTILYKKEFRNITPEDGVTFVNKKLHYTLYGENPWPAMTIHAGEVVTLVGGDTEETRLVHAGMITIEEGGSLYIEGLVTIPTVYQANEYQRWKSDATEEGTIEINKVVMVDGAACWVDYEFNGNCNSEGSSDSAMNFEGNGFSQDEGDAYGYKEIEEGNKAIYVGATPYSGLNINSKAVWSAAIYGTLPRYDKAVFLGIGGRPTIDTGKNIDIINGSGDNSVQLVKIDGTTLTTLVDLYVYEAHTKPHLYVIIKKADSLEFYVDGKLRGTVNEAIEIDPGLQIGAIYQGVSMGLQKFTKSLFGDDLNNETLRAAYVDALRVYDYALSSAAISALTTEFPYEAPESDNFVRVLEGDSLWVEANAWTKGAETFDTPTQDAAVELSGTNSSVGLNLESDLSLTSLTISEGSSVTIKKSVGYEGKLKIVGETVINGNLVIEYGAVDIKLSQLTIAEGGSLTFDYSTYPIANQLDDITSQLTGNIDKLEKGKINFLMPNNLYGRKIIFAYNETTKVYEVQIGIFRTAQEVIWNNDSRNIAIGSVVRLNDGTPSALIAGDTLVIADKSIGAYTNTVANLDFAISNAIVKIIYTADYRPKSVRVDDGGVFDINGANNDNARFPVKLNGGTMTNTGNDTGNNQIHWYNITLTKDSFIDTEAPFYAIAQGFGDIQFQLQGHKLTKRGSGLFGFSNTTFVGGGTIEVEEGSIRFWNGFVVQANTTLNLNVAKKAQVTFEQVSGKTFRINGTMLVDGEIQIPAVNGAMGSLPIVKFAENEKSIITLKGFTSGYFATAGTVNGLVNIAGNVTFDQGSSNATYTFKRLTGDGNLTLSNWTGCGGITYNINSLEDYTGTLTISNISPNAYNFNIGDIKTTIVYGEPIVKLVRNGTITYTAENTTVNGSATKLELAENGIYLIAATYNETNYRTLAEAIQTAGDDNLQNIHVYDTTTKLDINYVRVEDSEGNITLQHADNTTILANTAVSSWAQYTTSRLVIDAPEGESITVTFDAEVPDNFDSIIFRGNIKVVEKAGNKIQLSKIDLSEANLTIDKGTIAESFVSPNPVKLVGTVIVDTELDIAEGETLSFAADSAATLKTLKSKGGEGALLIGENVTLYIPAGVEVYNIKGSGKVDGFGTAVAINGTNDVRPAETWEGIYHLKNYYHKNADNGFLQIKFDEFASAKSKVVSTGNFGWFEMNADVEPIIYLKDEDGMVGLTFADNSNAWYGLKLAGDGSFVANTKANSQCRILIKDTTDFTGNINAVNRPIYFGTSGDNTATGIIVVNDGVSVNVSEGKTWTAKNGITINGTIKGSGTLASNTTFGEKAVIDVSEGHLTLEAGVNLSDIIRVKGAKRGDVILSGVSSLMKMPMVQVLDHAGNFKLVVSDYQLILSSDEISLKIPELEHTTVEVEGYEIDEEGYITPNSGTTITITYKPEEGYVGGGSITTTVVNELTPIRTDLLAPVKEGVKVVIREYKGAKVMKVEGLDEDGIATEKVIINGNEHSLDGAVDGVLIIELKP